MKHLFLTILWRLRNDRPFVVKTTSRAALAALIAGAFVGFAHLAEPDPSRATGGSAGEANRALLGELVGRTHTVRMYATPDGPRYAVVGADGEMIADDLLEQEVGYVVEGLTVDRMIATPMMTVADTPID